MGPRPRISEYVESVRSAKPAVDLPSCEPPRDGFLENFVFPLLPVRGARELVLGLARNWRIAARVEAALIIVGFADAGRKLIGRSRADVPPDLIESALKETSSAEGFSGLASACSSILPEGKPASALPFRLTSDAIGGVLLYSRQELGLSTEVCSLLATWSGRLVDQAAFIERQRAGRRDVETEKLAALAEFAAGAGHEINNPLATIAGRVQMLLRDEPDSDRRQSLATIGAQALRVRDMIGDLMLIARPPAPAPKRLLVNDLAQSIIDRMAETARSSSCKLTLRAHGTVFATADPTQLNVVLSELVRNSLQAVQPPGEIVIGLERMTVDGKGGAIITVSDNGLGLSEKDQAHLFDPFYSGRDAGRGLGFGLCKCWRIAANHGGWIEAESVPSVATIFRVFWPDQPDQSSMIQ
jgi:signal transduction histidine kinase